VRICILAAGAGGMYCGSCLRDNALAGALRRAGHDVALLPLYTPLRTDTDNHSTGRVFYGGVNACLQHATRLFRHTPRWIDWLLDRHWLLKLAGRIGARSSPADLGGLTLSILEGERGPQQKELRRLIRFAKTELRPQVVSLPNLMFIGMARLLRQELGVPVVCELTGEDIFLDALQEPERSRAREIIRQRATDVARFVATSDYYAHRMTDYLSIDLERIDVVCPGITRDLIKPACSNRADARPTIGYLARLCPEKGLDRLVEAFVRLRQMPGMQQARLRVAGYLGPAHRDWYANLRSSVRRQGLDGCFEHVGEVDFPGKRAFLDSIDILCVPTCYAEPKGIYVLEALARSVPAVLPDHGAFGELARRTGGVLLVAPGDAGALAAGLARLLSDRLTRLEMGRRGREAVRDAFTDDCMAAKMLAVYEDVLNEHRPGPDSALT